MARTFHGRERGILGSRGRAFRSQSPRRRGRWPGAGGAFLSFFFLLFTLVYFKHSHPSLSSSLSLSILYTTRRCLLNKCGDQTRDCIHSKACRDFMRCTINCGREGRRTERKDIDGLSFNPTKCAFACVQEQSESDAVKKFSLCTITSGCSLPLQ